MLDRIGKEYRFAELWDGEMSLVDQCTYATNVLIQNFIPEVHSKLVRFPLLLFYYLLNC